LEEGAIMSEKTLNTAKVVLSTCMAAKEEEKILILTDDGKFELAHIFAMAGRALNLNTTLVEVAQQKGGELPLLAVAALEKADVCLIITSSSFSHTKARAAATKRGCRIASMPTITQEIVDETCGADYSEIKCISEKIVSLLDKASIVRITSEKGTDLTLNIGGRKGIADTGILEKPGAFGNLPAGESMIAPVEDNGDGILVVDGVAGPLGKVEKPVTLHIKYGKVESTEGDDGKLSEFYNKFQANVDKIAEFGIGTNKLTRLIGSPLCDEKVFSTIHIGFGNNLFMGGKQDCDMHYDMIIHNPSVYLDDKCIIEEGRHRY